ncbi:ABC transporter substrate-binding protein [Blastococcus xanthinilyticus]|uniref:ABC-type glycerol-3-phosphate transport system substrate-binding protein n=1 Tax=Blastococcus xanthinilyticus TaxID=1564164 RepID=A0A5S5D018_9ACTN|nr:extracellular solute-binding protein [Blastococcus xanthinilyticus]TYP88466.1 ABC-type glycerol-3-phosphate transport system substrate-binding protein [Blastococcus xanthinilyticus]
MRTGRTPWAMALTSAVAIASLAACSSDAGGEASGKQVLRVVSLLPGSEQAAFDAFDARVAAFEDANPDIDVQQEEYEWEATTFASQLAGGTLPDVFEIPLTDARTLIENGQLADLNDQFEQLDYAGEFNENLLEAGRGEDGHVYAIPAKSIYGVALHYNRALFEQAGLDPDQPPTTWEEVRAYAKQIKDATGVAGYGMMASGSTGGWQLTAATYSRGGVVQEADGESYESTIDNDATRAHLEMLRAMRWEDDSLLADSTLAWDTINQAFAAGQVAMYTNGSDVYNSLVETFGVTGEDYGLTAMPLEGEDAGALVGGTLAAVGAQADDATKEAAVKWIDFFYLQNLVEEEQAVENAKVRAENGQAVGTPVLPIFSREQYDEALGWVEEYINVPLDQMSGYTDVAFDQPVIGEPTRATQEIYALLSTPVQAVITDQGADIDELLQTADTQAQDLLDQE